MQNFAKKILVLVTMVAFGAVAAQAQSENVVMSEEDVVKAIMADTTKVMFRSFEKAETSIPTEDVVVGKDIVAHAGDTIIFLGYSYRYKGGNIVKSPRKRVIRQTITKVVRDEALKVRLDTVEVETRTAAALVKDQQDMVWYETSYGHQIPASAVKENGLYFSLGGNYQALSGANAFGAQLGVGYRFDKLLWAEGSFGFTRNVFYKNSERAGEDYNAWYAQLIGGLKFDFGRRRNWSVLGYGGWRYTWQSTQTKEMTDEYGNKTFMQSSGKVGAPVWGLGFSYRLSDTGLRLYAGYTGSIKESVQQNEGNLNKVAHGAEVKVEVPLNVFKNMKTK